MDRSVRSTLRRSLRGRRPFALALALALVALAGCARAPRPPVPAPPPPRLAPAPPAPGRPGPGYEALRDSLQAIDPVVLRGRRIVLDPGHGGHFPGSIGVNGLTEAAVNLDVALHLRDLLVARGAEVMMTRETDRDFLTPADSTLHADLADRMRRANAFAPDLFVSIHHNADAHGAHDVNEIQTYYRLDDDGPSLDAARAMHRALTRNLSIAAHRIVPGNYFVLRTSEAPAILTESSYLTDPDVEARLALPEKRTLEAEALCLGIAGFFARGAPEVVAFGNARPMPGVSESESFDDHPALRARILGAFDRVELTVDGGSKEPIVTGDSIRWHAERPYAGGEHEAVLSVSLSGAGSAVARRLAFRVPEQVPRLEVDFPGQWYWDGRQPIAARVRLFDPSGSPHSGPLQVRVGEIGSRLLPIDTVVTAREGVAWAYFRPTNPHPRHQAKTVTIRADRSTFAPGDLSDAGSGATRSTLGIMPVDDRPRVPYAVLGPLVRTGFALSWPDGRLVRPTHARDDDPMPAWINRDGFAVLPQDSLGRVAVPALRGYRAVAPDTAWPPRFSAIAGGALIGRRIALDAEGGGDDPAGTGPSGARAADLNLDVARALAGFLDAAGAEVMMVRDGDRALADLERVRAAEAFHAERYLRIGHRAALPVLGHWFGSSGGTAWAQRTAVTLASLGQPAPPVVDEAQYALQQASCPALYVSLARVDSTADEEHLLAPGTLRAEAYALFVALAREFAPAALFPIDSLEVRDEAGAPLAGARVRLGGALTLQADATGRIRLARTEPGPLDAAIMVPGLTGHRVLLDSDRGVVLTGPPAR